MKTILISLFVVLTIYSCTDSDSKGLTVVQQGKSNYRIIYAEKTTDSLAQAIVSFKSHFKLITGHDLVSFADIVGAQDEEILIGKSNRTKSFENSLPIEELGADGYYSGVKGKKWVIMGNTSTALANGLYDIINELGAAKHTESVTQFNQMKTLVIPGGKGKIVKPDFTYRQVINNHALNADYRAFNQINVDNQKDWGTWAYSMERIFPTEAYMKSNPDFFAQAGGKTVANQINLANPQMQVALEKNLEVWTMAKGRATYWSISPYPNHIVSEDDLSAAIIKETGSPAGALIKLVNAIADKNKARQHAVWLDGPYRKAPGSIVPAANVMIVLDTKDVDQSVSLADGQLNESFRTDLAAWKKITTNIAVVAHVTNEKKFLMPFPNLNTLQKSLKYLQQEGVHNIIFDGVSLAGSAMSDLKFYVAANLAWDVDQSVDSLIWKYCDNTYGPAAKSMSGYITALEKAASNSKTKLSAFGSPNDAFRSWLTPSNINQLYSYFNATTTMASNNSELKFKLDKDRLSLIYTQLEVAKSMGSKTFGYFMNIGALAAQLVKQDNPVGKSATNQLATRKLSWGPIQGMKDLLNQFVQECDVQAIRVIDDKGTTPAQYQEQVLKYLDQPIQTHLGFKQGAISFNVSPDPSFGDADQSMLNDGVLGILESPTSNWIAISGGEGEVTWDLGRDTVMGALDVRFLQNTALRAFLPQTVECLVSTDGKTYTSVKKTSLPISTTPALIQALNFSFAKRPIQSIKLKTSSKSTCPAENIYAGSPAVVLIDELVIR